MEVVFLLPPLERAPLLLLVVGVEVVDGVELRTVEEEEEEEEEEAPR